jgi:very-short-patch-repair endonuclease
MTEERREAQRQGGLSHAGNLLSACQTLKIREGHKYTKLADFLTSRGVHHEFEYPLGDFVFDLALFNQRILVEFDSPYHSCEPMGVRDNLKDNAAVVEGWTVLRIATPVGVIITDPIERMFAK